jgi:hypothetical protein
VVDNTDGNALIVGGWPNQAISRPGGGGSMVRIRRGKIWRYTGRSAPEFAIVISDHDDGYLLDFVTDCIYVKVADIAVLISCHEGDNG